jgi:hypothetical protein
MKEKSILHSSIPIRGSETTQLDISLGLKNWLIHKIIITAPFFIVTMSYLFYKFTYLIYLMSNNKNIDKFVFFDKYFYITIGVGILLILTIGIKLGKLWNEKINEADKLITKDEYIRGSKLVCVDEFNNQFKDDEEFITFKIVNEKCDREF